MSNLNTRTFAGCTSGATTENTWCGTTNIVTDYVTTYNCATLALALALAAPTLALAADAALSTTLRPRRGTPG